MKCLDSSRSYGILPAREIITRHLGQTIVEINDMDDENFHRNHLCRFEHRSMPNVDLDGTLNEDE